PLPGREDWAEFLEKSDNEAVKRKLRRLQEIERLGAELLVVDADVTNFERMADVIIEAQNRFGEIHGVIHAAGTDGGGMIQLKTRELAASVLDPKIKGALNLYQLFKDKHLDFWVLISSMTSITGGVGQVDYCAANAFLDAFAHYNSSRHGIFTLSIDWCAWREVGMAANLDIPDGLR